LFESLIVGQDELSAKNKSVDEILSKLI
jgi:hypothetical protein